MAAGLSFGNRWWGWTWACGWCARKAWPGLDKMRSKRVEIRTPPHGWVLIYYWSGSSSPPRPWSSLCVLLLILSGALQSHFESLPITKFFQKKSLFYCLFQANAIYLRLEQKFSYKVSSQLNRKQRSHNDRTKRMKYVRSIGLVVLKSLVYSWISFNWTLYYLWWRSSDICWHLVRRDEETQYYIWWVIICCKDVRPDHKYRNHYHLLNILNNSLKILVINRYYHSYIFNCWFGLT